MPPATPDVPVTIIPPTDTPDVPPTIPPVTPVPTVDIPTDTPDLPPVDEPIPEVYWEEWFHYEKSVTITDFSYRFDATYTDYGFVESEYMSAYEYHADTVADYYRNSIGTEYFTESTAVSECFFEEYSFTACGFGNGFEGDLDSYGFAAISASYNLHSEIVSETISEGSYLAIIK